MNTKKNIFMSAKLPSDQKDTTSWLCYKWWIFGGWLDLCGGSWVVSLWWWLVMFEFGHGGYQCCVDYWVLLGFGTVVAGG